MDRQVTPPKPVTSPTWGFPHPCKQTLNHQSFHLPNYHANDMHRNNTTGMSLRWLDWIFWGGYLPSLSINYVSMSKDMGKRLPQLYYIKMKMSYDPGFYCNRSHHGNVTRPLRFLFIFVFL